MAFIDRVFPSIRFDEPNDRYILTGPGRRRDKDGRLRQEVDQLNTDHRQYHADFTADKKPLS